MTIGESESFPSTTGRVTIVIPIYADWPSLRACIASVITHADPERFDILLVNDCGPDMVAIEAGVLGMTLGRSNIRYERNPENLGFVRTCNRAVFELDRSGNDVLLLNSDTILSAGALEELLRVLYLSPWHGAVCPRSNDATIATIPFFQRNRYGKRDSERSREVHAHIAASLPEYTVTPVAIGFCFLVRRAVVDEYGLFDEVFGQGYNEENDFCLRINEQGYSSVMANKAFVEHAGSASFGAAQREQLERENAVVLQQRYPFFPSSVVTFIHHGYDAVDRFADLLTPVHGGRDPRVVFDISNGENGNAPAGSILPTLAGLVRLGRTRPFELAIMGAPGDIEGVRALIEEFSLTVIDPTDAEEVFDVGLTLSAVTTPAQLDRLRRCCLRWAVLECLQTHNSTRDTVEKPIDLLCMEEARDLADLRLDQVPGGSMAAERIVSSLARLAETPVNLERLRERDQRVSHLVRAWQHEHARSAALAQQLSKPRTGLTAHVKNLPRRLAGRLRKGLS